MGPLRRRLSAGVFSRRYALGLAALAPLSCGGDPTSPVDGHLPASVVVVAGDEQQGIVGDTLALRPTVRVLSASGAPVSGVAVVWEVIAGAGDVSEAGGVTSSSGQHSALWQLGGGAGEQRITARVAGVTPVEFSATGLAGATASVRVTPRDLVLVLQEGSDEALVEATALDLFDNATGDVVTWSVPDDNVAVVDPSGLVRAVGAGYSSVQGRVGDVVGGASLTVENPVPHLEETSPTSGSAGGPGMALALLGSGFVPQSVVFWNDAYREKTLVSSTRIEIQLSAEDLAEAGEASVRIVNGTPGGGSTATVSFTVVAPVAPAISSVTPATIQAGWGSFTLTVRGTDFTPQSRVVWNGVPLETSYVDSTELLALVSSSYVAFEGTAEIQVETAAPSPLVSNPTPFTIFSPPALYVDFQLPGNSVLVGDRVRLAAVARDQFGEVIAGKTITWSTGDPSVAWIEGEYLVGLRPGATQLEASAQPTESITTFYVVDAPVASIVFEGTSNGSPELFVRPLGPPGPVRRLLPPGTYARQPSPSPDAARLAFVGRDATGNEDIYLVHRDGSGLTRLTTEAGIDDQPAWSPDGQSIAFRSFRDGKSDVWVMDADGGNERNLTRAVVFVPEEINDRPEWSPDSQTLVFSRGLGLGRSLFKVGADGTGLAHFLSAPGVDLLEPAWSPDGASIAHRRYDRAQGVSSIRFASAETGQEVYYGLGPPPLGARSPRWLEDGWMAMSAPVLPTSPGTLTVALVRLGFANLVVPMAEQQGTLTEPVPLR